MATVAEPSRIEQLVVDQRPADASGPHGKLQASCSSCPSTHSVSWDESSVLSEADTEVAPSDDGTFPLEAGQSEAGDRSDDSHDCDCDCDCDFDAAGWRVGLPAQLRAPQAPRARRFARAPRVSARRLHVAESQDREPQARAGARAQARPKEDATNAFRRMREEFARRFHHELRATFGPGARVSSAPVSAVIAKRFLARWKRSSCDPGALSLAFHGTRRDNYTSIFRKGFMLPGSGRGRIPIANGNAHGAGIYTAVQGCACLSHRFCDSDSMLVCAVINPHDAEPEAEEDAERAARVCRRIGRAPKRPSACVRRRQAAGVAQPKPAMLGNYEVWKRSSEIVHVGSAMVVFNPSCVAPLLVVDRVPRRLYNPQWRQPDPEHLGERSQVAEEAAKAAVDELWPPGGNPNTSRVCDQRDRATRHELAVKRRQLQKRRQRALGAARAFKFGGILC